MGKSGFLGLKFSGEGLKLKKNRIPLLGTPPPFFLKTFF
jgi:hypothetical protein